MSIDRGNFHTAPILSWIGRRFNVLVNASMQGLSSRAGESHKLLRRCG